MEQQTKDALKICAQAEKIIDLKARVAQLEEFIEDNDLQVPPCT